LIWARKTSDPMINTESSGGVKYPILLMKMKLVLSNLCNALKRLPPPYVHILKIL